MSNFSEISAQEFAKVKQQILENDYRRITRPVNQLSIVSRQQAAGQKLSRFLTINDPKMGEITMQMSPEAFASFMRVLSLDNKTMTSLSRALDDHTVNKVIETVATETALKGKIKDITMLVMPGKQSKIIHFTTQTQPVATAQDYIRELEKIMNDNPKMKMRSLSVNENGGVKATLVNPDHVFDIEGMKQEEHMSGLSFEMDGSGLSANPYAMRLVCTNGMIGMRTLAKFALKSTDARARETFLKAIAEVSDMRFFEEEYKETAQLMNSTEASLNELRQVYNMVTRNIDVKSNQAILDVLEQKIPWEEVKKIYRENGFNVADLPQKALSKVSAEMSLWELVNAMTYLASNFGDQNAELQAAAGKFMQRGANYFDLTSGIPQLY